MFGIIGLLLQCRFLGVFGGVSVVEKRVNLMFLCLLMISVSCNSQRVMISEPLICIFDLSTL